MHRNSVDIAGSNDVLNAGDRSRPVIQVCITEPRFITPMLAISIACEELGLDSADVYVLMHDPDCIVFMHGDCCELVKVTFGDAI
jgi:hypothetical protein